MSTCVSHLDFENFLDGDSCITPVADHIALHFPHFGVDEVTIPDALQEMRRRAGLAIEETQTNHLAVEETRKRARASRKPGMHAYLDLAFHHHLLVCYPTDSPRY